MTDSEIIKALWCCKKDDCDNCPNDFGNCYANLAGYSLDLINRQRAEIDEYYEIKESWETDKPHLIKVARAEAVKEFAERLKEKYKHHILCGYEVINGELDDLLKEMVGEG